MSFIYTESSGRGNKMQVEPISQSLYKKSHAAKHTGTVVGLAAGSAYIIKNRKDLFIEGGKKAAEALGHTNKALGVVIPAAVGAAIVGITTLAGTLIGVGIDKIKNNIMQKKAAKLVKSLIAEQVQKDMEGKEPINLEELAAKEGIDLN